MFRTIVVPLDGSEFSSRAIPAAVAVGRATAAGLQLADLQLVGIARNDGELEWMYDHVHAASRLFPTTAVPEVDVFVDPDPTGVLLQIASDPSKVLCFASRDHIKPVATLLHSVGSRVIERAHHPLLVVGPNTDTRYLSKDVVVALDGADDPEPLLSTAASWALRLGAPLRIVTVYEPVLADLRRPSHFTRSLGPPSDPETYLEGMRRRVDDDAWTTSGSTASTSRRFPMP